MKYMTNEEFLEKEGKDCPNLECDNVHMYLNDYYFDNGIFFAYWKCNCGAYWRETYNLSFYEPKIDNI